MARRILLVEDEISLRNLLIRYLVRSGWQVDGCGSVAEAFELLNTPTAWTSAVIDLTLPDGSGDQVATQFRQRLAAAPLILTSGLPATIPEHLSPARFLQKPYSPSSLLALLEPPPDGN